MQGDQGVGGRYFEQINTLRLIAVAFVLAEHWMFSLVHRIGFQGSYGVWIFFTISGFLITGILLQYKREIAAGDASVGKALKVFYARRFLRIFPAYYLFLIVAVLIGPAAAAAGIWWHATYLSNFYFMRLGEFVSLGHLWSLAVEEQFYFVWPLLVLLVPRRALTGLIVTGVIGALLFRIVSVRLDWGLAAYVAPVACFDTLGLGALLAWIWEDPAARRRWMTVLTALGIPALIVWPFIGFAPDAIQVVVSPLVVGLSSVLLIDRCVRGVGGPIGRILLFKPFLYLGQISYGLYLYHAISGWMIPDYIGIGSPGGRLGLAASAIARLLMVIAVASLSWFLWEKPVNGLKRRFVLRPSEAREPVHIPEKPSV